MATMIGWNGELFARTKRIKPLGHYLKPATSKPSDDGGRDVRRMFERMIAKQGNDDGAR